MSFISWQFPFFLISFVLLYWRLPHRPRLWLLLVGSYIFYAFWDLRFLALVFTTTVVDYLCALGMAGEKSRPGTLLPLVFWPFGWLLGCYWLVPGSGIDLTMLLIALAASLIFLAVYLAVWQLPGEVRNRGFLILSIGFCLSILAYFKYFNFFLSSAASALGFLGLNPDWPTLNIILPVGISFYTFQSLAYVIDVYRGQGQVCRDFLTFAVFDAFFPQMVAGPIERSRQLIPQLETDLKFKAGYVHDGLVLILVGIFKKVFVADNCALLADYVFDPATALNAYWALIGGLAFAFQIYGDFSGYTDIARGTATMLGVDLVQNFRFPYAARNPSDFWSRWHISLSSWFRDYVYIPLGGNRGSSWQTVRNVLLCMLLAGLWHGASWVFVMLGRVPWDIVGPLPLRPLELAEPQTVRLRVAKVAVVAGDVQLYPGGLGDISQPHPGAFLDLAHGVGALGADGAALAILLVVAGHSSDAPDPVADFDLCLCR